MRRFLRRTMFLVPATLAVLVLGTPTAALGLLDVRLSCNDGTNLELALDAETVNQLQDAVSAINLYPAGDPPLSCSLTTSSPGLLTLPAAHADPNGPKDFAVGGGQFINQFVGCQENFAVSAHTPDEAPAVVGSPQTGAGGTVNLTFPSSCANPVWAGSHLVSKVDCVATLSPNTANFTAEITKSTGGFAVPFPVGSEIAFQVKDLNPTLADEIVGQPAGTHPTGACNFTAASNQTVFPVLRGNISVNDA